MILACSHVLLTTRDVPRMLAFLEHCFGLKPVFANDAFGECVTSSGFRIAVFTVVGRVAEHFTADAGRGTVALGVTVADVDAFFADIEPRLAAHGARTAGPPKEHPWGEKSFLLFDPDGNRWEIAQSPTPHGGLVDRP